MCTRQVMSDRGDVYCVWERVCNTEEYIYAYETEP